MSLSPDQDSNPLRSEMGRDWDRLEASLMDRDLMVSDVHPLHPRTSICMGCRCDLVPVVMRGPWAGLVLADLHFRVCPGCGAWILLSTVPAALSSR